MENEINLLKTQVSVKRKTSAFFKLCAGILLVIVVFTVGELVYSVFLRNQLAQLAEKQSLITQQITEIDARRIKFQTLKERLGIIKTLLGPSKEFYERFSVVSSNIPPGITVTDIDSTANDMTLQLVSSELSILNLFLESNLEKITLTKNLGVSKVSIGSVGINADKSGYFATVKFAFN